MNASADKRLTAELKRLYAESEAARRLFVSFASRKNDARETTVDRAANLAASDYQTMLSIIKQLGDLGVGTFIVGRHGHQSRIEWKYSIRSLGEIAMGGDTQPAQVDTSAVVEDSQEEEVESAAIKHEFQLRDGVKVAFLLPADVTEKEAERLALFIKALPF